MVDRDVVLRPELRTLELCSGYGGFSLGFQLAGVEHRTVCHVERDAHAASVLVARMDDKALDQAPVWSDLVTFDGIPWRGRVDLVTAGFPCQPWSAAGQKRGTDDDRWLWPHIARILVEVGPWLVFLENVPGLNRGSDGGGLSFVLQDLADLGFDAEWGLLSAADVGASQRRERLWILAVSHGDINCLREVVGDAGGSRRSEVTRGASGDEAADGRWPQGAHVADGAEQDVVGAQGPGWSNGQRDALISGRSTGHSWEIEGTSPNVADASSVDEREPHDVERSVARQRSRADIGGRGFPPRPDDADGWGRWIADGGPQPVLRRSFDGSTGRLVKPAGIADRLHLLGNGLVPLCAAHAFHQLSARFLASAADSED